MTARLCDRPNGLPHSILVAFDGSAHSWRALQQAAALAAASNAGLTLLSVVQQPALFASPYAAPIPSEEQLLAEAEAELATARKSLPNDLAVKTLALAGDPADTILRQAEQGRHDLIVMGTRGHGDAVSLAIGSVSHSVLRCASVPVLVIRDLSRTTPDDRTATPLGATASA